ncbi:MAG: helix-turn-helix domain-containing protein [Dysgonomonas sp.]
MANKSISMQKLRQLIRLYSQGKGTKAIAGFMSISRTTVKKYLQLHYDKPLL